jgi:hypothetical protein
MAKIQEALIWATGVDNEFDVIATAASPDAPEGRPD